MLEQDNPEQKPLLTSLNFVVQTYDIDFAGHVSNQVYIRWLEDLRLSLLNRSYPLENLMNDGILPVLMRTDIRYRRSIEMFEPVEGHIWIKSVGTAKVTLFAEIVSRGIVCAEATQIGAFLSRETGKPGRVPRRLLECMEPLRR